jgi:hypothetical protein
LLSKLGSVSRDCDKKKKSSCDLMENWKKGRKKQREKAEEKE